MSKIINCSFVMDISEFSSIDFYFGETIDGIEENYDITKHYPTTGELTHGDIQLELTNEEFEELSENFFIEAKLNMTNEEGSIKAFTHKIKKEQALLGASLTVDSNTTTTVNFYLGEDSIMKYDYDQSFNKPLVNGNILEGNKTSVELGIEQENWYYVDDYIAKKTAPIKEGKLFGGWFTDETLATAYTSNTGLAYAHFVDNQILKIKTQFGGPDKLRFVSTLSQPMLTSVDNFYFIIKGVYGENVINSENEATNFSRTLPAGGQSLTPQQAGYPEDSYCFGIYTLTDLDCTNQPIVFSVKVKYKTSQGYEYTNDEVSIFKVTENAAKVMLPSNFEDEILSKYPPAESTEE